jgi:hypothetical protein
MMMKRKSNILLPKLLGRPISLLPNLRQPMWKSLTPIFHQFQQLSRLAPPNVAPIVPPLLPDRQLSLQLKIPKVLQRQRKVNETTLVVNPRNLPSQRMGKLPKGNGMRSLRSLRGAPRKSRNPGEFSNFYKIYSKISYYCSSTKTKEPPAAPANQAKRTVKEYPSGNTATSASRIAFLRSLCSLDRFGIFVNFVQKVVSKFLFHK